MRPLADKSRQPGVLHVQQRKVLRQLAVKEFRGVFAFHANHAEVGQGAIPFKKAASWLNYDAPSFHTGSRVVRRLLAWVFVLLIASGAAAAWWLHEPDHRCRAAGAGD